jgi:hypothetical protein
MAEDDKRLGGGPRTRLKAQTTNSVGKDSLPLIVLFLPFSEEKRMKLHAEGEG